MGRDYLNEREIYYIKKYQSLISENGYNLTIGGDGCAKGKLSFDEKCKLSKIFSKEEIMGIQQMLCDNYEFKEILQKYPQLTNSFLSNINNGLNFKRDDLIYPLKTYHTRFNRKTQLEIISDIKNNVPYSTMSKKYNISTGLLSLINNGKIWYDENQSYPIVQKVDYSWVEDCKREIIFSNKTLTEIAKDFNISYSTIKLLTSGKHHYDENLIYPLRKNKIKNQKIYEELFNIVSTIPGETGSTAIIDTQSETV